MFNEKHPKGSKKIEFRPDGSIGEGRNANEAQWQLDDEELVIWQENGDLQNRFRYMQETDRFISTDDLASAAVKRGHMGQFIEPAS